MKKALILLFALCAGMAGALTVNWTAAGGVTGLQPFLQESTTDYRMGVLLVKGDATAARTYLKNHMPTNGSSCFADAIGGIGDGFLSNGKQTAGYDAGKSGVQRLGVYYEAKNLKDLTKGTIGTFQNVKDYTGDITLIFSAYKVKDGKTNGSAGDHAIDLDNLSYYEIGAGQWKDEDTLSLDLGTIQLKNGIVALPEPTVPALLALGVAGLALKRKIA